MITVNGLFDEPSQKITAPNTGTWADLVSWDEWNTYVTDPPDELFWLTDIQDLGSEQDYCLTVDTQATGLVDYYIYTSNTGAFAGEETEHIILLEAAAVPSFRSRYFQVGVGVELLTVAQEITQITVTVIQSTNRLSVNNLDTSTINDGSTLGLVLPLGRTVGTITNIQITPQECAAFTLDVYVTDNPSSRVVIPTVTSKTGESVSFTLTGLDNEPRDAVVDVLVEYLPEMFRSGNALRVR